MQVDSIICVLIFHSYIVEFVPNIPCDSLLLSVALKLSSIKEIIYMEDVNDILPIFHGEINVEFTLNFFEAILW